MTEPTPEAKPTETDEQQVARLMKQHAELVLAMEAVRLEHETQADGSYHRCACDLCKAHRMMEDPNLALARATEDYEALSKEYEALCMTYDAGTARASLIRTDLHGAIGFYTKGPDEMAKLIYDAVHIALTDAEFKANYDRLRAASHARSLEVIKKTQETEAITAKLGDDLDNLSARLNKVETTMKGERP